MTSEFLQVVGVVVLKENSVLLVRHVNSKHIENIYGLPGGKKEVSETHAEAARRELEEETGLLTTVDDLVPLPTVWEGNVAFKTGSRLCAIRVFLCTRHSGNVRGTKNEIPEWIPLKEVKNLMLLPNVENAIGEGLGLV